MRPHTRHPGCIDPSRLSRLRFALWSRSLVAYRLRAWWRDRPADTRRRIGAGPF